MCKLRISETFGASNELQLVNQPATVGLDGEGYQVRHFRILDSPNRFRFMVVLKYSKCHGAEYISIGY